MVLSIIEYIGKNLLSENPYIDTFGANCITTKDGRVVNFIGKDKEDFGPSDIRGIGSYARIEPTIEYTDIQSKTSSCKQSTKGSIKFRLVVFQVNAVNNILNPAKLENKIWADLQKINFNSYAGNESQISLVVNSSDLDFYSNFTKEVGKKYEVGADAVIIALNCTLTWSASADNCEICSITGSSSLCIDGVTIKDELGQVVAIVECGGDYILPALVPQSRTITINGVTLDLSQDRSWTVSSGGGENLSQTLALGNNTGGQSMLVDTDDLLYIGNVNRYIYNGSVFLDQGLIIGNDTGSNYIVLHDSGKIRIDTSALELTQLTPNRVPYINSSNLLVSSAVSDTELGYISGLTSNAQTQLNGKEASITAGTTAQYWRGDKTFQTLDTSVVTENTNLYYTQARFDTAFGLKSTTNLSEGTNLYFTTARVLATTLAGLSITGSSITSSDSIISAFGKLQNQINGVLGGAIYQGVWNANTNSPTLSSGSGTKGYYYVVSVAGSTNLDGTTDWKVGDWAIFNGATWDKVDNTDAVSSVNGAIGAVVITVTGTTNRISVSGGNGLTPTIDISASYAGQSSITTLGTVATGTWQATAIADSYISSATNWNTAYTNRITSLTTTGSSGAATLSSNTLNIPNYTLAGLGGTTLAAVNAQNLSVFAATTSAQLAGVISDETGTGALVFGTSPTFTTQIIAPVHYGSSASGGTLLIDSTSNSTKGAITFGTSSSSNIYNFNVGTSTNVFTIRERIGSASQAALYIGVAPGTETSTNYMIGYDGTLRINHQSSTGAINLLHGNIATLTITTASTVANSFYTFSSRSRSTLTTTANIPVLDIIGSIQSWAAGTVPLQYFNYLRTNTMGFASGSTTTYVASLAVEYTTRGTNAVFGTSSGIYIPTLAYTSTTTAIGVDIELATGATNSYGLRINAGTTTSAPIKLTAGTNMTTAVAGVFEYDGTNLFFTRTGTTRQYVMVGASGASAPATNSIGVILDYYGTSATRVLTTPNTWITYVEGGTTYKIPAYT